MDSERKLYRAHARKLAEKHAKELDDARAAGKNPHQVSIDQSDRLIAFISKLPTDKGDAFLAMYTEELDALTQAKLEQVDGLVEQATEQQLRGVMAETIGAVVAVVLLFLALIAII